MLWRFLKFRAYPVERPPSRFAVTCDEIGENGSLEGLKYVVDRFFVWAGGPAERNHLNSRRCPVQAPLGRARFINNTCDARHRHPTPRMRDNEELIGELGSFPARSDGIDLAPNAYQLLPDFSLDLTPTACND
jgi:hypothetical protein